MIWLTPHERCLPCRLGWTRGKGKRQTRQPCCFIVRSGPTQHKEVESFMGRGPWPALRAQAGGARLRCWYVSVQQVCNLLGVITICKVI